MKTDDLQNYTLFHTSEDDWEFEGTECKNKCVYRKVGEDPDYKFCFKTGSHDSKCIGNDIAYFHLDSNSFSFSFINEAFRSSSIGGRLHFKKFLILVWYPLHKFSLVP